MVSNVQNIGVGKSSCFFKNIAIFSVGIYIILSSVFEGVVSGLSRISSLAIYFCLACCALYIFSRGTVRLGFLAGALIVFGVVTTLSILYSPTSSSIMNMYIYRYWTSVILVIIVANTVTEKEDVSTIIDYYVIAGVCMALYMYFTYGFANLASATERLDSEMGNQNAVGITCGFGLVLSLYQLVTKKQSKLRFLYIISAIICVPAIMFTGSRKSVILVIVALITFVFMYTRSKNIISKVFWIAVILAAVYLLIYYVPAFQVIRDRVLSTFEVFSGETDDALTGTSDTNRMKYINVGLQEFLKSPAWGNGYCYSYYVFGAYSHNNYVELLMNGGLIAFASYYSIYFYMLHRVIKNFKDGAKRAHVALTATVLVTLMVIDFGVVSYYNRYTLILIALCLCDFSSKNKEQQGEK